MYTFKGITKCNDTKVTRLKFNCTPLHIIFRYIQKHTQIIIFPRNVSFRGYYVFDSNAAAAAPPPPSAAAAAAASSHHFVVSAITFEGFKLRSSNLTHALFIQISRTSSITDIVVQSKMAAGGHFVQKFQKKKSCVSI